MFTISVEIGFHAAHGLRLADETVEDAHRHDWVVRAHFVGAELDDTGMVIDFTQALATLRSAVEPLEGCDLNTCAALGGLNPTAEIVARYVFERVLAAGVGSIHRVEVTEAPGCEAWYEAPRDSSGATAGGSPPV